MSRITQLSGTFDTVMAMTKEDRVQYQLERDGERPVVRLSGRMTFADQTLVQQMIDEMHQEARCTQIIDLTDLEFIDSSSLGLLLRAHKSGAQNNVQISLRVPTEGQVAKLLSISRFHEVVPFV